MLDFRGAGVKNQTAVGVSPLLSVALGRGCGGHPTPFCGPWQRPLISALGRITSLLRLSSVYLVHLDIDWFMVVLELHLDHLGSGTD